MNTRKILATILCAIMLIGAFVGCESTKDKEKEQNEDVRHEDLRHIYTIISFFNEDHLVSLEYNDDEQVSRINFYQMHSSALGNDMIIELDYDNGKINEAVVFGITNGQKQSISDSFDVKYNESGNFEYLYFTSEGEPYLKFTAITNEDGKPGYKIDDGSEDMIFVVLGANGLVEKVVTKYYDGTVKYDDSDRIIEYIQSELSMTLGYEGENCCFSKLTLSEGEISFDATVERNEKHQMTLYRVDDKELGIFMEQKYKYSSDDVQMVLSSKTQQEDSVQEITYTYDDNDKLKEYTQYRGNDKNKISVTEKYNDEGIRVYYISSDESYRNGILRYSDKYELIYDDTGAHVSGWVESKRFDSDGNFESHTETISMYGKDGDSYYKRETKKSFDENGNVIETVITDYDKDGNKLS